MCGSCADVFNKGERECVGIRKGETKYKSRAFRN